MGVIPPKSQIEPFIWGGPYTGACGGPTESSALYIRWMVYTSQNQSTSYLGNCGVKF